jgi:hypothetical protein
MRSIPELQVGRIGEITIAEADRLGEDDFLKRWIQVEGPERILAWAATKDPEIQWEGMYAHRCQSCMRLYKDPKVRQVIADHHQEKMADVILGEFLLYEYDYARANDETAGEGAGSDEPWPFAIAENGEAAAGLDLPAAPAPVTTSQPESFPIVV